MTTRSTSSRSRSEIPRWILIAPIVLVATVTCYAPTEVVVDVSTDVDCAEQLNTVVYRGRPERIDLTNDEVQTTAKQCYPHDPPDGINAIGTLTLIPSGDRDGRAAVKVVLTRGQKRAIDCGDGPNPDCIVARRSFSFLSHSSRRLPIHLTKNCFGVPCDENNTCVEGVCVPIEATCTGDACNVTPPPPDPGPIDAGPIVDAKSDAPVVLKECGGKNGDVLIQDFPPAHSAASANYIYFTRPGANGTETDIARVSKKSGAVEPSFLTLVNASGGTGTLRPEVLSLAVDGETVVVGYRTNPTTYFVNVGTKVIGVSPNPSDPSELVVAAASSGGVSPTSANVFLASDVIKSFNGTTFVKYPAAGPTYQASALAVSSSQVQLWDPAGDAGWVLINRGDAGVAGPKNPNSTKLVLTANETRFFGYRAGGQSTIFEVVGTDVVLRVPDLSSAPSSLAVDKSHLYWAIGPNIRRASVDDATPSPPPFITLTDNIVVDHVMVDPEPTGCIYFWTTTGSGGLNAAGTLHVRKKP